MKWYDVRMNQRTHKSWKPTRPISTGASAYHDAVVNASWHIKNIRELIKIVKNNIKKDGILVDFGAGTGASAVYILELIKQEYKLWLVDNSPSWLGKAYDILHTNKNVDFFILEKVQNKYQMLHQTIGKEIADYVLSANTVHLIPDITNTFKGIYKALKKGGTFTFQSGNIKRQGRDKGILMIDDSIGRVHDIAISIIKRDRNYKHYKKNIIERVQKESAQRKLVFPEPKSITYYIRLLKHIGFCNIHTSHKKIVVNYKDWLSFLRVRRLQAGILPEIGGREPTPKEEQIRDELIVKASHLLFKDLEKNNPLANHTSFTTEWIYVQAQK